MTKSKKISAGILLYRLNLGQISFFLVHPGGPFFKNRDNGVWSIPKGEIDGEIDFFSTALREFEEEVGLALKLKPADQLLPLEPIVQKNNKIVQAWACLEPTDLIPKNFKPKSNLCEIEWPPRSGQKRLVPEVDQAEFFPSAIAKIKINPTQINLIEQVENYLKDK